jgi:hypothetical protein
MDFLQSGDTETQPVATHAFAVGPVVRGSSSHSREWAE